MSKQSEKLVSVVIPTFNRCDVLVDCVESVLKSEYRPLEVVIADNASTDNTESVVKKRFSGEINAGKVKYLRLPENRMAAGGRNAGYKEATGKFILFLDCDNLVESDMVSELVRCLGKHPAAGLVAPLSIQAIDKSVWTLGSDYDFWTSRPLNRHEGESPDDIAMEEVYTTRYSPNAMMVTREAMEIATGFDSYYRVMYEEADFGFRITGAGFKGLICPKARTLHLGALGKGQKEALRRLGIETVERTYCFARNRSVFMRRFAPWYCQVVFFIVFIHVFTAYYCWVALRHRRPGIAWAYWRGAFAGVFTALFKMPRAIF